MPVSAHPKDRRDKLQKNPKLKALLSAFSAFTTKYLAESPTDENEDAANDNNSDNVTDVHDDDDDINTFFGNGGSFKRIGGGLLGSHNRLVLLKMIQDYTLFFLAYHILFTGYAWGVWGILACSLLSPPPISFGSTLTLTLAFAIVIVVGSLLGSPVGLGEFEVNSGCFSLLLVGTYWCWSTCCLFLPNKLFLSS
jgi:hypothetical protein